jgi:hypothetical protein
MHFALVPKPDYYHVVTEAIGAVESLAKIAEGQPTATFSGVLPELARKLGMPHHLRAALRSFWLWTCNDAGRHGTTEPLEVDGAEARLALITCSSIINFVIAKHPELQEEECAAPDDSEEDERPEEAYDDGS